VLGRISIATKFFALLVVVLALNAACYFLILNNVYSHELRAQAQTVVANVEAFGAWVAKHGRVWVKAETSESFLGQESYLKQGDDSGKPVTFFSKNPALAQREFSEVVHSSSSPAKFRMTSHNVMNPINAPDAFETRALNAIKTQQLPEYAEFYEGSYRYAKPVYHTANCIACHGDPAKAPVDVIKRYGDKNGFGFKEGDVAGVISVTIPTVPLLSSLIKFIGPLEILLVVVSIVLAMGFVKWVVIKPITRLTLAAQEASLGRDVKIDVDAVNADTGNEIQQLALALNRLKSSTQMAIKKMREAREAAQPKIPPAA
jgi:hypothetical protein